MTAPPHLSVLLSEVTAALLPRDGAVLVDGTFGAGGHTRALLDAAGTRVYAIDRDPSAIATGRAMERDYPGRLTVIEGRFGAMAELVPEPADGVTVDVGVSSMQLDRAERGFSFRFDGPLDMRMEQAGPSAADLVNTLPEAELADLIWRYGEERRSRAVARAICARRTERPYARTGELADTVRAVVRKGKADIDPATRTFQALRIAVNDELGEIERGLDGAESLLRPGGRLAVISFHSLEDRLVKRFLKQRSGDVPGPSRHMPAADPGAAPTFRQVARKAIHPTEDEIRVNPRARSAKLRVAERTDAPGRNADRRAG